MHPIDTARALFDAEPTTEIDIQLGAVTYHTTVNDMCDLFLNLMPALTDGDLRRLRDTGCVARRELLARTSETLQRIDVGARRRTTAQSQMTSDAQVPDLGVIHSNAPSRKRVTK